MGAPFPDDEKAKLTLFINTWYSTCGNCGKDTHPAAITHDTVMGYGGGGKGCDVKFEYVGTNYINAHLKAIAIKMRPDLEWYSPYESAIEAMQ